MYKEGVREAVHSTADSELGDKDHRFSHSWLAVAKTESEVFYSHENIVCIF